MPWFFFDGISRRSADELLLSFAATPLIEDPRHGRVEGEAAFRAYVGATREWLAQQRGVDPVALTKSALRTVEEVSVKLAGAHPELPVAIATDLAADRRIAAIRVYHSLWPLTGAHQIRPPLLQEDLAIELEGPVAQYQRALAAGDAEAIVACFEPDGVVREPSGGPYTYRGAAHDAIYAAMFANGGGIPLQFCTATDDGTRCAIEYNCARWGKDEIPPQAGAAVYERGRSGRLAAARIYDDVTPPAVSDSNRLVDR
jgi:SnoaL-like domain